MNITHEDKILLINTVNGISNIANIINNYNVPSDSTATSMCADLVSKLLSSIEELLNTTRELPKLTTKVIESCNHRLIPYTPDPTSNGYQCVDCGALFEGWSDGGGSFNFLDHQLPN